MSLEPTSEKENERPRDQDVFDKSTGRRSESVEIGQQEPVLFHKARPVSMILPRPSSFSTHLTDMGESGDVRPQKELTISPIQEIAMEPALVNDMHMLDGEEHMPWIEYPMDLDIWKTAGIPSMNDASSANISFPPFDVHLPPLEIPSANDVFNSSLWAPKTCFPQANAPAVDVEHPAGEGWPLANCNSRPLSSSSARRASIQMYTDSFQQNNRSDEAWQTVSQMMYDEDDVAHGQLSIASLSVNTRDRLLATAQSLLQKALNSRGFGLNGNSPTASGWSSPRSDSFFALPPSNVLESLLRSFVNSAKPYYSLARGTVIDPNEMLLENQSSTLLLLLMIAQGASSVPMPEARYLTAGLTEACRILLFDLIENNMDTSVDIGMLRSALQFTTLAAWGGHASHMHFAIGQRGMYTSVNNLCSAFFWLILIFEDS